jgi:TRAP-type C4-dicarboxylate transport system permease small subunit
MDKVIVQNDINKSKMHQTNGIRKVIQMLNKIIDVGYKILVNFGSALIALIICTITVGVISRYVFNKPFAWTEELGILLLVWISLIGACCAGARNKHVLINLFVQKLPDKKAKVVEFFGNVFILFFLILMLLSGIRLQPQTAKLFSVVLMIPRNYYFLPVAITAAYLTIITIRNMLALLAGIDDYRASKQSS